MPTISKTKFFAEIGYRPHEAQRSYHDSFARFKIASWGRRAGKSMGTARDMEPELFLPNRRYWVVAPSYDLGEKEFRVVWDDLMVGKGFAGNRAVKRGYTVKQGTMYIEFPWRTRLEVRSADHAHLLVGEKLDGVIFAEAAKTKGDVWHRYVRPALADTGGWATFTSTPEGMNWFYEMWKLGQDPNSPEYESWRFPSWINNHVFPGGRTDPEILLLEKSMSYEEFQQEIAADFTSFSGKIYGEFQDDIHVRRVQYNPALPSYMGIDFGFTNPLAGIEFQVDPFDNVYVWREHYQSYLQLSDHIAIWKGRENPEGYRMDLCFGDAADPEAISTINSRFAPCMGMAEAKKNWRQGIEVVKRFLKSYEVGNDEHGRPILEPKLFIDHSCVNLIKEFQSYRSASSTPLVARELPQRQHDHGLDALRYGLMHIFELGAVHHLTEVYSSIESVPDSNVGETFFRSSMEF